MNQELLKDMISWKRRDYRWNRRVGMTFKYLENQRIVIAALEKQVKVMAVLTFETGSACVFYDCPVCGSIGSAGVDYYGQPNPHDYRYNNCSNCGQAIDWEVKND